MSEVKAIKGQEGNDAKLNKITGELQVKLRRPVSIEEAMKDLIKHREKGRKISDLADSWNITDSVFKEIKTSIDSRGQNGTPQNKSIAKRFLLVLNST